MFLFLSKETCPVTGRTLNRVPFCSPSANCLCFFLLSFYDYLYVRYSSVDQAGYILVSVLLSGHICNRYSEAKYSCDLQHSCVHMQVLIYIVHTFYPSQQHPSPPNMYRTQVVIYLSYTSDTVFTHYFDVSTL
jgi:hypothetical protein